LIPETQNGFMATYRTNNNPLLLRVMSDRAAAEGKILYVAVVDLKNAFPAVNHNVLFLNLNSMGVAGDLIDLIMLLYDKLEYMVRVNKELSESFFSFLGVLTGDSGSPQFWNLLLAGFKLFPHPGDIAINGRAIPKLEHADDLMILSASGHGFQAKLNGTGTHMGNIGCEIQTIKCLWGAMGIKPNTPQDFYLDGKLLKAASMFQYVGIWHDLNSKDMYAEHHRIYLEKAERMANACLAVNRMVGGLTVWDARTLYMARVDPYLISAADICPDVVKSRRMEREAV
jgi:hypothetical protein